MCRTSIRGAQNLLHALFQNFQWRKKRDGSRLPCTAWPWPRAPAFIERLAPIQAYDVRAGRCHLRQQARRFDSEIDHRHAHLLD